MSHDLDALICTEYNLAGFLLADITLPCAKVLSRYQGIGLNIWGWSESFDVGYHALNERYSNWYEFAFRVMTLNIIYWLMNSSLEHTDRPIRGLHSFIYSCVQAIVCAVSDAMAHHRAPHLYWIDKKIKIKSIGRHISPALVAMAGVVRHFWPASVYRYKPWISTARYSKKASHMSTFGIYIFMYMQLLFFPTTPAYQFRLLLSSGRPIQCYLLTPTSLPVWSFLHWISILRSISFNSTVVEHLSVLTTDEEPDGQDSALAQSTNAALVRGPQTHLVVLD